MRSLKMALAAFVALATGACSTLEIAQDLTAEKLDQLTVPARQPDLVVLRGVYIASAISLYGADAVGRYSGKDMTGDARALAAQIKSVNKALRARQTAVCTGQAYSAYDYLDYLDHRLVPLVEQSIRPAKRYWSNSLTGLFGADAFAALAAATTVAQAIGRLAEIDIYAEAITQAASQQIDGVVNARLNGLDVAGMIAGACPTAPASGTPAPIPSTASQVASSLQAPSWFANMDQGLRSRMCANPAVRLTPAEVRRIRAFLTLASNASQRPLTAGDFNTAQQTMVQACKRLSGILQEDDACELGSASWANACPMVASQPAVNTSPAR